MAPLSAWLPVRSSQDFDLVITIVGPGLSRLTDEFALIGQSLVERGLNVMAQGGRLHGRSGEPALHLRLSSVPFYSLGHGLDVLAYLGDGMPEFRRFSMQRGSVLLWDPSEDCRARSFIPEGVIAYSVPFKRLAEEEGDGVAARGLVAAGALLSLLGCTEEVLCLASASLPVQRSVNAGYRYARERLVKRDVYTLPPVARGRDRILLNPHQAVMLGFAAGYCACAASCQEALKRSPSEWVAEHLALADGAVSFLESGGHPDARAYRGAGGEVFAFLRADDHAIRICVEGHANPKLFVASDVPDALRLLAGGPRLIRDKLADVVGVVIENELAARYQSVCADRLADDIRPRKAPTAAERTGARGAEVGYIAWGAAQGVVRDAVALCRNFGLSVAALYPRAVLPFPVNELESFAKTVKRVVIVEADPADRFADRVRATCSFNATTVGPEPGRALTPMDIFLREGLGA